MGASLREQLLRVVAATREKEADELLPHCDDLPPAQPGRWTVKDHLAHMAAWRQHAAVVLEAARRGEAHTSEPPLDERNAAIYEATRSAPAAAVAQSVGDSWAALRRAIEASSEEDLSAPLPAHPERQAWEVIPGNTHQHLGEHLEYLAVERGDEPGALAAARWVHDLALEAFTDARNRASAAYNLACFYARRGRESEALPLLRDAFSLNPALVKWARDDPDLQPIRDRPAVIEALRA